MMEEIEIVEKEIGNVIEIEERIPMWKMPFVMGKDFKSIMEYLKANGGDCADAPYARYLDVNWNSEMTKGAIANFIRMFTKRWHFHAGIPTQTKLDGTTNLVNRYLSNKRYVKTMHYGPYHKVGMTYKKMYAWAKAQELPLEGEAIEFYLNDPRNTKKESLKTMVLIPLGDNR